MAPRVSIDDIPGAIPEAVLKKEKNPSIRYLLQNTTKTATAIEMLGAGLDRVEAANADIKASTGRLLEHAAGVDTELLGVRDRLSHQVADVVELKKTVAGLVNLVNRFLGARAILAYILSALLLPILTGFSVLLLQRWTEPKPAALHYNLGFSNHQHNVIATIEAEKQPVAVSPEGLSYGRQNSIIPADLAWE